MKRSFLKSRAALALAIGFLAPSVSSFGGARAQSDPSWYGTVNGMGQSLNQQLRAQERQMRAQQRQQQREERLAEQRERMPHPVSAAYTGTLTPVDGLASMVSNRTLYLQTPIVANGTLSKIDVYPIYLEADGKSFSQRWSEPWQVNGSNLCFSNGQRLDCMTAMSDSTGQAFLRKSDGLLVQVGKVENGDSAKSRIAYAQAQKNAEQGAQATAALLGALLTLGGGENSSDERQADAQRRSDIEYNMARTLRGP